MRFSSLSLNVDGVTTEGVIPHGFWFSYGDSTVKMVLSAYYASVLQLVVGISGLELVVGIFWGCRTFVAITFKPCW